MANIKQSDVAPNQNSGSSIAKAAKGGNVLPPDSASRLNSESSGPKVAAKEPRKGAAENKIAKEDSESGSIVESDNSSNVEEQLRNRKLASAVTTLNDHVQNEKRDLEFVMKNEAGNPVVKITNRTTGELIRQLPGEEVVDLARKLNDQEPLRLFSAQV